jgi:FKBP-type peptidyl-prolyl cis-trans isomerase FkpA
MDPKTLPRAVVAALLAAASSLIVTAASASQEKNHSLKPAGQEVVTPSGLKYTDLELGQGEEARTGKILEVHYVGWIDKGARFDSSRDREHPFTFRLGAGDAIKGWDEGLVGMKVGGKRRLTIPPELGFGKQGVGSVVPPNAILVYEFELLGVR